MAAFRDARARKRNDAKNLAERAHCAVYTPAHAGKTSTRSTGKPDSTDTIFNILRTLPYDRTMKFFV